jgi:hypothetical protein
MGPGIFLIAIMGCGEGNSDCQQVRLLDTHFESKADCMAASEGALMQNSNVEYPTVVAQCVSARQAASFRVGAAEVQRPEPPVQAIRPARMASRD